jgi:4-diphosphocytidyl-2-C-methyl-D-erythritol kinase
MSAAPERSGLTMQHTRAYAKVNLTLGVAAPLSAGHPKAGFHEIASWMAAIDLCDDLFIQPCERDEPPSLTIEWAADAPRPTPIDWPIERDLVWRTRLLLERTFHVSIPVRMRLVKRIPVGGGLGGGSSDSGAAFMALGDAFFSGISREQLRAASAELGSDIAFFIHDGRTQLPPPPAIVSGFGDRIERTELVESPLALFIPAFGCPTGPVYKTFDALLGSASVKGAELPRVREIAASRESVDARNLFNDLAAAAEAVAPQLGPLRRELEVSMGVPIHVTGSGSCMFALSHLSDSRVHAAQSLGCAVVRTRIL